MKELVVFIGLTIFFGAGNLAGQEANTGIDFFKGSWADLLNESKKQNKPIFVDAYAVWCGPCRWMDANVFPEKEVGDFYNKNFINYKFDMEKGEGRDFAKSYQVRAYPTLLYLNSEGDVKYRAVGGRPSDGLIAEGKKALTKFEE